MSKLLLKNLKIKFFNVTAPVLCAAVQIKLVYGLKLIHTQIPNKLQRALTTLSLH